MTANLRRVTVSELCEREGFTVTVVIELVEHEIARPLQGSSVEDWVFDATAARWLNRAVRLQRDLEVDWAVVAMLVDQLRQRERLDEENRRLRQRLERFLAGDS